MPVVECIAECSCHKSPQNIYADGSGVANVDFTQSNPQKEQAKGPSTYELLGTMHDVALETVDPTERFLYCKAFLAPNSRQTTYSIAKLDL